MAAKSKKEEAVTMNANTVIDEETAAIETMRFKTRFAKTKRNIVKLKEHNAKVYWDVLWNSLSGGNLLEEYAMRYAQENYLDWSEQSERNQVRSKFSYLEGAGCSFDQRYLLRNEDGSFDLDHEKIDQRFRELHTYTFTEAQMKAVNEILEAIGELGIRPSQFEKVFRHSDRKDQKKVIPNLIALGKIMRTASK